MGPSFVHSLLVRTQWNEDGNPISTCFAAFRLRGRVPWRTAGAAGILTRPRRRTRALHKENADEHSRHDAGDGLPRPG
jgi:hypothetical protein